MEALVGTVAALIILGAAGLKIDREYERGVIISIGSFKWRQRTGNVLGYSCV